MTKSTLRSAFNGISNHGERRENTEHTEKIFKRGKREHRDALRAWEKLTTENAEKTQSTQRESLRGEKENTKMLFEHGRIFLSLLISAKPRPTKVHKH
jgi:hypothetical protein